MKIERTKNATKNLYYGLINKIVGLVLPFISRTVIIYTLGAQYLGITSLFSSILNFLSLAELGFGSALVFSMYKAIADDDRQSICALVNFYKKCYRIIGIIIGIAGLCLVPFLKLLIKGEYPSDINIHIVYIICLSNTVVSYFLFAYKNSLLTAHQRVDVVSKISTLITISLQTSQIILLVAFRSFYMYVIVIPLFSIINNLITGYNATKMYPSYKAYGEISKGQYDSLKKKIAGLFVYKIGGVVSTSADNIVISAFLGLIILAKYNNYYYIIVSLFGFLSIYYNAMTAGLGNSIALESVEKNYKDFKTLQFMQGWIVGWSSICLLCLFSPFMKIWLGEKWMFNMSIVLLLAIYFYCWKIQDIVAIYKDAAGMWDQDKFRPLICALLNLVLNIILVKYIGIYGVILSTSIAQITLGLPWASRVLFMNYFKIPVFEYFKAIISSLAVTIFAGAITYLICILININNIVDLLLRAIVCLIVPNIIYFIAFKTTDEFYYTKERIYKIMRKST